MRKTDDAKKLEGMSMSLATCTYEHNTLWGIEVYLYSLHKKLKILSLWFRSQFITLDCRIFSCFVCTLYYLAYRN
jgi:hypothetical protein